MPASVLQDKFGLWPFDWTVFYCLVDKIDTPALDLSANVDRLKETATAYHADHGYPPNPANLACMALEPSGQAQKKARLSRPSGRIGEAQEYLGCEAPCMEEADGPSGPAHWGGPNTPGEIETWARALPLHTTAALSSKSPGVWECPACRAIEDVRLRKIQKTACPGFPLPGGDQHRIFLRRYISQMRGPACPTWVPQKVLRIAQSA
ncbi:unnamed protein product [Prorocentrum cordatum]|uniref:Thiol oxidase n=1 Tax=Prorocentrum cordatum TaxID=2364126 RepID=A0ABN9Q2B7_9DINO|nr:unnamed protein product [Polarella glacialis]